jgi:hypothetical protein
MSKITAASQRCRKRATLGLNINPDEFLPSLDNGRLPEFNCSVKRSPLMSSVKTIATLASVAAIASSAFAFSWVGLALLGF